MGSLLTKVGTQTDVEGTYSVYRDADGELWSLDDQYGRAIDGKLAMVFADEYEINAGSLPG